MMSTATAATANFATAEPPNQSAADVSTPVFASFPRSKPSITNASGHGAARSATSSQPRIAVPSNRDRSSARP